MDHRPDLPHRPALFASACAGIFVFGIVLALLGTLFGLPEVRARLSLDLAGQGDLFFLLFFGLFLATVSAGLLIDRFGSKLVLTLSSGLVAAGMFGFTVAASFAAAAVSALVLGLGGGGLNTASNALVSELYDTERGRMLNLLGIFFGLGAIFIPLLAATLTAGFSPAQLTGLAATLAAACTVAYALLGFPRARQPGASLRDAVATVRYPGVMLFAMLLFFQSGNEAAISGWTSTYIGQQGAGPRTATWILTGYWAALILGRLIAAQCVGLVSSSRVVLASGVGSIAGALLLVAGESIVTMSGAVALLGLSYSSVYPTTLAMAGDRYRQFAGTVFGLLFSVALIGGMLFPWAVGRVAAVAGLRAGMLLPVVGAVMICVVTMMIARRAQG